MVLRVSVEVIIQLENDRERTKDKTEEWRKRKGWLEKEKIIEGK